eukprot:12489760-Prorocentrum_lima.AAC.1
MGGGLRGQTATAVGRIEARTTRTTEEMASGRRMGPQFPGASRAAESGSHVTRLALAPWKLLLLHASTASWKAFT